ncbi:putative translation initiation factor [Trachipleistophora hominis]|uniref:Putative translation initiation factor n=1 Tax=Trachipleistophora hominis TaxID=72359 RepID=L7JTR3_TRAHO|nr:putative translation initiation factor [Trachipleistophora hominis]
MKPQVVAQCENGLILDVFSSESKVFPCLQYKIRNNILCYYTGTHLIVYDLEKEVELSKIVMERVKKIEVSTDCWSIGVLLQNKVLNVMMPGTACTKENKNMSAETNGDKCAAGIVFTVGDIFDFKMSDCYLLARSNKDLRVFKAENSKFSHEESYKNVKDFYVHGTVIAILDENGFFTVYKNQKKFFELFLEKVDAIDVRNSPKGNFLLLCTIKTKVGSYFGAKELILFDFNSKSYHMLDVSSPNYFTFIKGGYAVCHSSQPSVVSIYDYSRKEIRRFPKGIRNRIYYNGHGNIVCFAGFDNLSGMIEIYDAQTSNLISSLKMLGASVVEWSPCGSYFLVAITNALKVDNKVVIYDYFGRKINEKHFGNLINVEWIGCTSDFQYLEKPVQPNIYREESYVPPSFSNKGKKVNSGRR